MTKSIGNALKTHLAGAVTTLAACWLIERVDGTKVGYTTLDADLTVSGQLYRSTTGFSRTALTTGASDNVDNMQVLGFFDASSITEQDLKNGLYDYAQVKIFIVNWRDLSQGIVRLRAGWLGEVLRSQNGTFHCDLNGLNKALQQEFGNVFTPTCRADLGDSKCTVPIAPASWTGGHAYTALTYAAPATKSNDALLQAVFQATTAGTSGSSEPTWNTTVGATTSDGSVVWTSITPFRLIGTVLAVVDNHHFIANPLSFPSYPGAAVGNTATLVIRNNVSANTAIEFSDGTNTANVFVGTDQTASWVHSAILAALPGSTAISVTNDVGTYILTLTNTSGKQGNIVVTGDIANPSAFLITDFAGGYLDAGTITWLSGNNTGTSHEMKNYAPGSSQVTTWLGMNYAPQIGDRFMYYPGCDKRRETCFTKFNNILNFRGEPDIPGLDAMLAYPAP